MLTVSNRASLAIGLLLCAGCSMNTMTGDMMSAYSVEHMQPYLMTSDDLGMACQTGVSMGAYLMSFERVTDAPHKAALSALVSAGMCAEADAFEAELDTLRHLHARRAADAQDALIRQKRAHYLAARRFHRAYQRLVAAYGEPGKGCPEFDGAGDEMIYLVGLSAGVQAVMHDRAAGGRAGVPLDTPLKVTRATECVDSGRWWGLPQALRAAVWTSVPGALPEGADAWATLREAVARGDTAGNRMARAVYVQAAVAAGRPSEEVRGLIREQVAAVEKTRPAADSRLLDAYAHAIIIHFSDVMWTQGTGHRTPDGSLGTFWDDTPDEGENFLEGLGDEETPKEDTP